MAEPKTAVHRNFRNGVTPDRLTLEEAILHVIILSYNEYRRYFTCENDRAQQNAGVGRPPQEPRQLVLGKPWPLTTMALMVVVIVTLLSHSCTPGGLPCMVLITRSDPNSLGLC